MSGGQVENAPKGLRSHVEPGGVVGRIDIERAGVGANESFESGEIMSPIVLGFTSPFADGCACAFRDGEGAFVARRFDDSVILGSEKSMVEEKDGFFRRGDDNELIGADGGINGSQDFAKPRGARGFGVTAPVLEKGIVGAGFEGQEIFDGDGFGVGGGKQVLGRELVFGHVFFDAEGCNLHGESVAMGRGHVERQIGRGQDLHAASVDVSLAKAAKRF